jgi:hypothetical protein
VGDIKVLNNNMDIFSNNIFGVGSRVGITNVVQVFNLFNL